MANEILTFSKGLESNIPTSKIAGRLLVAEDTGNVYLDLSSSQRIQIKDNTKLPLQGGGALSNGVYNFNGTNNLSLETYYNTIKLGKGLINSTSASKTSTTVTIKYSDYLNNTHNIAVIPPADSSYAGLLSSTLFNRINNSGTTSGRVLITTTSGKYTVSHVTSTELGRLDGITSNVQTQLNNLRDKFETGIFTPKLTNGSCSVSTAKYIKIDKICFFNICLNITTAPSKTGSEMKITNLPFEVNGYRFFVNFAYDNLGKIFYNGSSYDNTPFTYAAYISNDDDSIKLRYLHKDGRAYAWSAKQANGIFIKGGTLYFSGWYRTVS